MWGYLAKNQVPGFWPQTASANCHMPNIGDLALVHLTDQLSNFRIIPDYLKVVDFIEEAEG